MCRPDKEAPVLYVHMSGGEVTCLSSPTPERFLGTRLVVVKDKAPAFHEPNAYYQPPNDSPLEEVFIDPMAVLKMNGTITRKEV